MQVVVRVHRRRRLRRAAAQKRFLTGTGLFLVGLTVAMFVLSKPNPVRDVERPIATSPESKEQTTTGRSDRPVYPFSIVPGGATSVEELRSAMAGDPVVAAHFSNFNLTNARVVELPEPRVAHVSYRMGNDVYWTRRPVRLEAGEKVITDGENVARTRCGNQIADTPLSVSPFEPTPEVLDTPVSPDGSGKISTILMPPVSPGPPALPPGDFPTVPAGTFTTDGDSRNPTDLTPSSQPPGGDPGDSAPPPATGREPIPEPATTTLLVVGALGVTVRRLRKRRPSSDLQHRVFELWPILHGGVEALRVLQCSGSLVQSPDGGVGDRDV
jgi:hypothetical protein